MRRDRILSIEDQQTTISCVMCKQEIVVSVAGVAVHDYLTSGRLIQEIMPDLPAAGRELFISGTCGECWKKIFSPEEVDA